MFRWLSICLAILVFPESSELLKVPALITHYHQHIIEENISFLDFLQEHYQEATSDQEHHELPFKDCSHHQHLTYYYSPIHFHLPTVPLSVTSTPKSTFFSIAKPITRSIGVWQPPRIA